MFGWFKKKEVKKEYVDVGVGWMFLTRKDTKDVIEGYAYHGAVIGEGMIVDAKYTLELQFRQQAERGFFKLKDGSYINADLIEKVEMATDSYMVELK